MSIGGVYTNASIPTLSTSVADFGATITIYTNRVLSSYVHTLTAKIYSSGIVKDTKIIGTKIGESYSWTIPSSWMNYLTSESASAKITIFCDTYGTSLSTNIIGSNSVSFTVTLPSSVIPTIDSVVISDIEGVADLFDGNFIQKKSRAQIEVTASGVYGSTITSYKIVTCGQTYNTNTCTTPLLNTSGKNKVTITVTDSRGRTVTAIQYITVLSYSEPSISLLNAIRCNADGTKNGAGSHMKISASAKVSSIDGSNIGIFSLKYKDVNSPTYTEIDSSTIQSTENSYCEYMKEIILDADPTIAYNIKLDVSDNIISDKSLEISLVKTFLVLHLNDDGNGISFGEKSTESGFSCAMDAVFKGEVTTYNEIVTGSDERLKNNITDIDGSYITLLSLLKPKTYNFENNETLSVGLIAQDLLKSMQETNIPTDILVKELKGSNGYLGINYTGLIPILIAGYKDLLNQVAKLQQKINEITRESEAI